MGRVSSSRFVMSLPTHQLRDFMRGVTMNSFFSGIGIQLFDFIQISTMFVLTLVVFFGVKNARHFWLNYFLLFVFTLQCIVIAMFHDGLVVKLFAVLMLASAITVQLVVKRRKPGDSGL